MAIKKLTARGVKTMLARARVDYSALTITEDSDVWVNMQTGAAATSVKIEGPADVRTAIWGPLEDCGLACAPYPDYDMWSRR
jgi:hypothetical protein